MYFQIFLGSFWGKHLIKTLPKSSYQLHWTLVRFNEMGDMINNFYFSWIQWRHTLEKPNLEPYTLNQAVIILKSRLGKPIQNNIIYRKAKNPPPPGPSIRFYTAPILINASLVYLYVFFSKNSRIMFGSLFLLPFVF